MNSTYGKVALLMGGQSSEREISLKSGNAVLQALQSQSLNVDAIDVDKDIYELLNKKPYDRVFNILHGRGGEDGQIQALLELLELPYTGSGVAASAIAMDKLKTKKIWKSEALPTPNWLELKQKSDCGLAVVNLGLPLIVKPVLEGSSVGITKVNQAEEIMPAWQLAKQYGVVIAEQWIDGEEYTTSILNGVALPIIRLEPANEFYDYEAKYLSDDTKYHCPCGLSADQEKAFQEISLKAFEAIGASGWGRVDFMLSSAGDIFLIELNTVPGMTSHSLVPMAAKQAGISFEELVVEILKTSNLENHYA